MKENRTQRPVSSSAVARLVIWLAVFCIFAGLLACGLTDTNLSIKWMGIPLFQSGAVIRYDDSGYSVGNGTVSAAVTELSVEWVAGNVTVVASEGEEILIEENYSGEKDKERLRWKVEDGELDIKFCAPLVRDNRDADRKDLTVSIPSAMLEAMDSVSITGVNCDISYTGNGDELSLTTVNGAVTVSGDIGELDVEAVDLSMTFRGGVRRADVECVSGNVTMYLDMAAALSFDQLNGDVTLYLSEDITGFATERDSLGVHVETEGFESVIRLSDAVYWGDKSLRIDIDGLESKLKIEKLTKN